MSKILASKSYKFIYMYFTFHSIFWFYLFLLFSHLSLLSLPLPSLPTLQHSPPPPATPEKPTENQQKASPTKKWEYFSLHIHRSEDGWNKWSFLSWSVKKGLRDLWSVGFSDSQLPDVIGKGNKAISSLRKRRCSQWWRKITLAPLGHLLLSHCPYSAVNSWMLVCSWVQRQRKT